MLYALLIYSPDAGDGGQTDGGATERMLSRHRALQDETRAAGTLAGCVRLAPVGEARTVRRTTDGTMVTDGPFAETKEWLAGFYLIDCKDEVEALRHAETICCRESDRIELRPVYWQPPEFRR